MTYWFFLISAPYYMFLNNLLLHLNEMCHIGNYKEHVYHDNSQHIHQTIIIF